LTSLAKRVIIYLAKILIFKGGSILLINGDCIKEMKKLSDKKENINCIIADIPYDEVSSLGAERAKYSGQLRKINKEKADVLTFSLDEMLKQMNNIKFDSAYIFVGINQIHKVYNFFKYELNKDYMCRLVTWHKTNPSPANGQHMFLSASEYIIFVKRRKTKFNGSCIHNVLNFPTCKSKLHPTEKPQKLLEFLIKTSTHENDVVLDFCMGSGSTGVACKSLNRKFIGIELDEKYFNVAKKRIEED